MGALADCFPSFQQKWRRCKDVVGGREDWVLREMQSDAPGTLISLEIACHSVGNHNIQLAERIALGCDAPAARRIPTRHITARNRTRLNLKEDFSTLAHTEKIPALETGVNRRTWQAISSGAAWRGVRCLAWSEAGQVASWRATS